MSGIAETVAVRLATRQLPRSVDRSLAKIDRMPDGIPGTREGTAKHIALGELAHKLLDSSEKRLDAKWVLSPAHQRRNVRSAGADASAAAEVLRRVALNDAVEPESQKQALLGAMQITGKGGLLENIARLATSKSKVSQVESQRQALRDEVGQLTSSIRSNIPEPVGQTTALDVRRSSDAELLQQIEEQIETRKLGAAELEKTAGKEITS